jgi:peptidoglycan hydrolase-like protein with peptidoglycan-binding domain
MGVSLMNSRRGIIVGATVPLLGLASVADLRAAEDRPAGFDCTRDRNPLAVTVCNDRTLTAVERRTTENYLAAYFGLGEENRPAFHNDHIQWINGLAARCAPSPNPRQSGGDQPALSVECVKRLYTQRGDLYRKRLSGAALEESNLSPALLKKIQKRLTDLKFLSGTVDGVFGADTRTAIKSYQASAGHAQGNFLTAQERNVLLASDAPVAQTSLPKQPPVTAPEPASVPTPAQRSTTQDIQSADNRPHEPETTDHTAEQPAPQSTQNTADAANPPANADAAAPLDMGGEPQTQYFMAGALLAAIILAFAALFVFFRLRRRAKRAIGDDDVDPAFAAPVTVSLKVDSLRPGASTTDKHAKPSVLSDAHGIVVSVARDAQRVDADAPLAPERMAELLPHFEKGAKS